MNQANPSSTQTRLAPGPWLLAGMIVAAALSRLLPHPPNFSPVEAIALFGGAHFASRGWAMAVPLLAMLLSDLVLATLMGGTYFSYMASASFWLVYACIALTVVLGFGLRGKATGPRIMTYALIASTLFFLVTNFGTWAWGTMYPNTTAGLMTAYLAGVPFFQWTLLGTLFYAAALFGAFALLRHRVPALRVQTV